MLRYLGLTAADDAGTSVPAWKGVSKKARALVGAAALALAVATFFIFSWLLDGRLQGFAGYVPWLAASAALLLSVVLGERGLVRASR
ncbi:hypothetical protein AUR04nite_28180 [Glutamicibacter uratoxydans]|uniref:Uncharacterized protein n=1 Tax=Glutamicibacter uratoxydans TaxID=43667 RepID=A0A4Y4DQR8_GLUUR|nr:hypothetical protein [Glutamicibacter uratoxydans]GED07286.1 hypothetical protein AUR04nite_28180 [Glutamicibacter uratoxydans]